MFRYLEKISAQPALPSSVPSLTLDQGLANQACSADEDGYHDAGDGQNREPGGPRPFAAAEVRRSAPDVAPAHWVSPSYSTGHSNDAFCAISPISRVVLASACLPRLQDAVEIDGEPHWASVRRGQARKEKGPGATPGPCGKAGPHLGHPDKVRHCMMHHQEHRTSCSDHRFRKVC